MPTVNHWAAGIEYRNAAGEYAAFDSLRHTSGTFLKSAGIHAKVIQQHMRHSTTPLTMDRYSHPTRDEEAVAVNALPALHKRPAQRQIRISRAI